MKIIHLISTMHQQDCAFLLQMNLTADAVVVNQTDRQADVSCEQNGRHVRMLSTTERGLSNSRNMLIEHATGDVAVIGDDDLEYVEGYEQIIQDAYRRHPEAEILAFCFSESRECETRVRFSRERQLNIFNISQVASVEITFRLSAVKGRLSFCPLLGLGAPFGCGEENAFLADALRKGLTIVQIPRTICCSRPAPQERIKWKDGYDRHYFLCKGAAFYRIYGWLFLPVAGAFLLSKKRNIFAGVPLFSAFCWMLSGRREFLRKEKESSCS